jgi:hypothetical protein
MLGNVFSGFGLHMGTLKHSWENVPLGPDTWRILKREDRFALDLGMVILAFEGDENRRSMNIFIGILETLKGSVEDGTVG